ncbi:hypothetical protein Cri9333_3858 [Crinalium epipsammum PCC 9333]|uniref:Uncharacterized protein n=1 Tax=Crinalium epipsammum PCC 9333 TaxID=1173022 RepID=K9W4J7_9CYAN|nr:hypothetical protein [Crinalium epipsammum]AFZ14667.1 hypothetical protein Cri9333_3858 [Crinalium epipsammum PCC 9333]
MSQTSSIESLHPVIQTALSSLDIQLEEELVRYRRQKAGHSVMPNSTLGRTTTHLIDLMAVDGAESINQPSASGMATPISMMPPSLANPEVQASVKSTHPNHNTASTTDNLESAQPEAENLRSDSDMGETSHTRETSFGGDLVYQGAIPTPPNDYLASSEELLRSLAEEEAELHKERSLRDNLLTPLAVGSLLLLLLTSATLGYIVTNPSVLQYLGGNRFSKSQPEVAPPTTQSSITDKTASETPITQGPNLAAQEFVDLNINNLSTLKMSDSASKSEGEAKSNSAIKPKATSLKPATAENASPQNLADALLPPEIQPIVGMPTLVGPPPAAQQTLTSKTVAKLSPEAKKIQPPAATANKVAANPAQLPKGYYYVLANYQSDRQLANIRKIVGDAYVLKFPQGSRIKMAAFDKESQAKTFIQVLQKKGISASVYRP